MNRVQIESKGHAFAVQFVENGKVHEMDVRTTLADAEDFAVYLAARLKLDVFYRGEKLEPRRNR